MAVGQRVGRIGLEEQVGRTADLEGRVGRERLVAPQARAGERSRDLLERRAIDRRSASDEEGSLDMGQGKKS